MARCNHPMAQDRLLGTRSLVARVARVLALTLVLLAAMQPPPAALHAAVAGAGASVSGQHLYWSNDGGTTVGRAWLDGSHVDDTFVTGGVDPERLCGVAIAGTYLYWAIDVEAGVPTIGRAKLDGTGVNWAFISGTYGPVCGLAVDWRHIYWASYAAGSIGRAKLDGTGVNQNFIRGLAVTNTAACPSSTCSPTGLAVDDAHIYWGEVGSIGRASLDGTGVNQHFITGLDNASGVAISSKYIYWTDQGSNQRSSAIGRARLDGTAVQRGFITGLDGACGLAITERYIFWGQFGFTGKGTTLGRANLDGSGVRPRFVSRLQAPCGVAVGP